MPAYFFCLIPFGEGRTDDPGVELRDVEQAYLQAYEAALDISFEMLRQRQDPSRLRFEVTNQAGELLFELPFTEVLAPKARLHSMSSLHARLHRNCERQRELAAELHEQFQHAMSTIAETRELLARPIPH